MLTLERSRGHDSVLSQASIESIGQLRVDVSNALIDYIREAGEIVLDNSILSIENNNGEEIVTEISETDDRIFTTCINTQTFAGNQVQTPKDKDKPEEVFDITNGHLVLGGILIDELMTPGSVPAYSELANMKRSELIGDEPLTVRSIDRETLQQMIAVTELPLYEVRAIEDYRDIYWSLAWPNREDHYRKEKSQYIHAQVAADIPITLAEGAEKIPPAKHAFIPITREHKLRHNFELNYQIPLGSKIYYFNEDIETAIAYAEAVRKLHGNVDFSRS